MKEKESEKEEEGGTAAAGADADQSGAGLRLGLTLGVLAVVCNFAFDGCGMSRVSSYYSHYDGSAGYSHLILAGRVESIEEPPSSLWRNLHYGSKLRGQKVVKLQITRSEVPLEDFEILFANEKVLGETKPGQLRCFHVSHVGNYYSFLFRSRYSFEAYAGHEFSEKDHPDLAPRPGWQGPYKLYSVCAIALPLLFLTAAMGFLAVHELTLRRERLRALLLAAPFLFLYMGAAAYITWLDWVDRIWPIGKSLCLAILIGMLVRALLKRPAPKPDRPSPARSKKGRRASAP